MKVNYEEYSDYTLPCLTLNNDNKHYELGVFANRHRRYLKNIIVSFITIFLHQINYMIIYLI